MDHTESPPTNGPTTPTRAPGPRLPTLVWAWLKTRGDFIAIFEAMFRRYGAPFRLPVVGSILVSRSAESARREAVDD